MKKKLFLIGLLIVLLTAAIMVGSVRHITNSVLQKGSLEEFATLALPEKPLYRAENGKYMFGSTNQIYEYLAGSEELRQILGGVTVSTDKQTVHLYVTEPTQELRDQLQKEDSPLRYAEVCLSKCSYTFDELLAAEEKLASWLEAAPESVKESVQLTIIMPKQNRVAVYVKDWNGSDHTAVAKAMGPDSPKFYVVEGDLRETTSQIKFMEYENWRSESPVFSQNDSKEAIMLAARFEELSYFYRYFYKEDDPRWRAVYSFMVGYGFSYAFHSYEQDGSMTFSCRSNPLDQVPGYDDSIYPNKEWTPTIEYTQRVILNAVTNGEPWLIVYGAY